MKSWRAFRTRPFETVEAHACLVSRILNNANFNSFLYLSSARVYQRCISGFEDSMLSVNPSEPDDLYNITKLAGESICLSQARPEIRVARLTNVFGYDPGSSNFLSTIITEAISKGSINLYLHPDSAKDYVSVDDVIKIIPQIALNGQFRVYNIGCGERITNREIVTKISQIVKCKSKMSEDAPKIIFPEILIDRLRTEFDFKPTSLANLLPDLVREYQERI